MQIQIFLDIYGYLIKVHLVGYLISYYVSFYVHCLYA